jgi:hypothetical protein
VREGALISCSTFNRHRHDAPAQYELGRTLYREPDCGGSDDCDAVGVGGDPDGDDGGCVDADGGHGDCGDDEGCVDADGGHGDCADPEGAAGSCIDSESGDADGDLAGGFALALRFAGSADARVGAQVGHFEFDFAAIGTGAGAR